jgi:hypothetical protein
MSALTSTHQAAAQLCSQAMQVLTQYVQGTEHSDVQILEQAFHEHFRVVAKTQDGLRVINRGDYLSLIAAKKIGGNPRELSIDHVIEDGNILQVSLKLVGESQIFHDHIDLINEMGDWKILHNTTEVTARS